MDVASYFAQKEREYQELSLAPDRPLAVMFAEQRGSRGMRGMILGNLWLAEGAFIAISEVVQVVGNNVTRISYAYFLVVDGEEIMGHERDPTHDPPVHRHGEGHGRGMPDDPIAFKDFAEQAWQEYSARNP